MRGQLRRVRNNQSMFLLQKKDDLFSRAGEPQLKAGDVFIVLDYTTWEIAFKHEWMWLVLTSSGQGFMIQNSAINQSEMLC